VNCRRSRPTRRNAGSRSNSWASNISPEHALSPSPAVAGCRPASTSRLICHFGPERGISRRGLRGSDLAFRLRSDHADRRNRDRRWERSNFTGRKGWLTSCEIEEFLPFVWADGDVADLGLTTPSCGRRKLTGWSRPQLEGIDRARNGLKQAGRNFSAERSGAALHHFTGRTLSSNCPLGVKRMQIEVLSFAGGDLEAGPITSRASRFPITPVGRN
jgi:hypothetical protein